MNNTIPEIYECDMPPYASVISLHLFLPGHMAQGENEHKVCCLLLVVFELGWELPSESVRDWHFYHSTAWYFHKWCNRFVVQLLSALIKPLQTSEFTWLPSSGISSSCVTAVTILAVFQTCCGLPKLWFASDSEETVPLSLQICNWHLGDIRGSISLSFAI